MTTRLEIQRKVWWVLYLITTYTVFTIPEPVSSISVGRFRSSLQPTEASKSNNKNSNDSSKVTKTSHSKPSQHEDDSDEIGGWISAEKILPKKPSRDDQSSEIIPKSSANIPSSSTTPRNNEGGTSTEIPKTRPNKKQRQDDEDDDSEEEGGWVSAEKFHPRKPSLEDVSREVISSQGHGIRNQLAPYPHLQNGQKQCNGLENLINDAGIVTFVWGVGAAIVGVYVDVVPFLMKRFGLRLGGTHKGNRHNANNVASAATDIMHYEFVNSHDGINSAVVTESQVVTARKGTTGIIDIKNIDEEALGVTAEIISLVALVISVFTIIPSFIERFFMWLDWIAGKDGRWSRYLYMYKCYPPQVSYARSTI